MKITYQVGYKSNLDSDDSFDELLAHELIAAFADEYEEVGEADIFDYFQVLYEQSLGDDESLIALVLDIPAEGTVIQQSRLIGDIHERIRGLAGVFALFKFGDESLFSQLQTLHTDIFNLEMRLREVTTLIFADTYRRNYFNHLRETKVKTSSAELKQGDKNKEDRLKSRLENEFFHISFSNYCNLIDPRELKELDLLSFASESQNFEEFRNQILYRGVQKEAYRDFFSAVSPHMEALEKCRNCVAHNRMPSDNEVNKFVAARDAVKDLIDDFFERLRVIDT